MLYVYYKKYVYNIQILYHAQFNGGKDYILKH